MEALTIRNFSKKWVLPITILKNSHITASDSSHLFLKTSSFSLSKVKRCPKILLEEDNPIEQTIYREFLYELGCHVTVVENGQQALDRFASYDLIILDIGLPDMSGIEVCKHIRQLEAITRMHIPVIALTAYGDMVEKNCYRAGFDDFAEKPIDDQRLKQLLKKWLSQKYH